MPAPTFVGLELTNLGEINVVLGKNGCGKSCLLREIVAHPAVLQADMVEYVSPERAGTPQYDSNQTQQFNQNSTNFFNARRANQHHAFRQQTVTRYANLEAETNREDAQFDSATRGRFAQYIKRINALLDNIEIHPDRLSFGIRAKSGGAIDAPSVSSGEAELISLSIECFSANHEAKKKDHGWLLLDEPDVHLHPDLQARFGKFLVDLVAEGHLSLIISTHSTPLVAALASSSTHIYLMRDQSPKVGFRPISDQMRDILPVFGAHPLSNVFNQSPPLIVEGDDDVWIWQKARRASKGKVGISALSAGGNGNIPAFEKEARAIIEAVYDDAKAFSLIDRDDRKDFHLYPEGPVIRLCLECRAAENLLLSEDVLATAGTSWAAVENGCETWISANPKHQKLADMQTFKASGFNRTNAHLKEIQNILASLVHPSAPWQELVGTTIGRLSISAPKAAPAPLSLQAYLGSDVCRHLLGISPTQVPAVQQHSH